MCNMRTKRCILFTIILVTSITLIWYNTPSQSTTQLKNIIVSNTQLHIKNLNVLNVNNQANRVKELDVESTYLELLGFVDNPKIHSIDTTAAATSSLLFVTAFTHFGDNEKLFIESKLKYFPNDMLFIYDIDLSFYEQLKIQKLCNVTCKLRAFKAEKFPPHIKQAKLKAYKPIIIQEVLNEHGFIIWIEPNNIILSNQIDTFLNMSLENGLATVKLTDPVTRFTHPTMFKYMKVKVDDFYFVHMIDTTMMFLLNNRRIHYDLMQPWIKCALREDCIAPPGAQLYGCELNRRPEFLYSGCHRYESSALGIIAAQAFNYDFKKYSIDGADGSGDDVVAFFAPIDTIVQQSTNGIFSLTPHNGSNKNLRKRKLFV